MSSRVGIYASQAAAPGYNFGNALEFDGVNDYVTLGKSYIPFRDATISLWFKNTTASWDSIFLSNGVNSRIIRFVNNTTIRVGGGVNADFTVPTMSMGNWYHIMIQIDNLDNSRVYLNGAESSSGTINSGSTLNIARISDTAIDLAGVMDDLYFSASGVAGDATDAAAIYNGGSGADPETILGGADQYYKFNESGSDSIAVDEAGSGGGTLVNFTLPGAWVAH